MNLLKIIAIYDFLYNISANARVPSILHLSSIFPFVSLCSQSSMQQTTSVLQEEAS